MIFFLKRKVLWVIGTVLSATLIRIAFREQKRQLPMILFSEFLQDVHEGLVSKVYIGPDFFEVFLNRLNHHQIMKYRTSTIPATSQSFILDLLCKKKVKFGSMRENFLKKLLPVFMALVPMAYLALTYRMLGKMLGGEDSVAKTDKSKSEYSKHRKNRSSITFADVAGVDQAKIELEEIVDFLKHPEKYNAIGAKMPKGVLLSGPAGTGKTLLARALAFEAGVPFMFCSASDFVEMLVGRGAARVRELFTRASDASPCIIFVDELDALAKARGGLNSNDEREQTLNQLLTEMDGFEGRSEGVIVIAATNRPEVLDPALCRPGRFDRHVRVPLPDCAGREAILRVHSKKIHIVDSLPFHEIAKKTAGFSGADLASIVNDAALLAVRRGDSSVHRLHLELAIARCNNGLHVHCKMEPPLDIYELE